MASDDHFIQRQKLQVESHCDQAHPQLGLAKFRDTFIGGTMMRGTSRGERKRLSFAIEILTNLSLLFADEPTSGFDSYMAETVVLQLQQLAQEGRTVVVTIHQPSSELFMLFDTLYLLADGATVYRGKAAQAVAYVAALGFPCPGFVNPSDFFMRQLTVFDGEKDEAGVQRVQLLKDEWASKMPTANSTNRMSPLGSALVAATTNDDSCEDARLGPIGMERL